MKESPEKIYLQIDNGDDLPVTWAADSIYESDIRYIRADKYSELETRIEAMKCSQNKSIKRIKDYIITTERQHNSEAKYQLKRALKVFNDNWQMKDVE